MLCELIDRLSDNAIVSFICSPQLYDDPANDPYRYMSSMSAIVCKDHGYYSVSSAILLSKSCTSGLSGRLYVQTQVSYLARSTIWPLFNARSQLWPVENA